jgi:hypothetical protein
MQFFFFCPYYLVRGPEYMGGGGKETLDNTSKSQVKGKNRIG